MAQPIKNAPCNHKVLILAVVTQTFKMLKNSFVSSPKTISVMAITGNLSEGESVSAMKDLLPAISRVCLCHGTSLSGSMILYL